MPLKCVDAKKHPFFEEMLERARERTDRDNAAHSLWYDGESIFLRTYEAAGPENAIRVATVWPKLI